MVEQHGGKYVQEGRWQVPARIELRTRECRVVLDFTHAVVTSNVLRIETDMVHGKLFVVSAPDIAIDTDGLALTYSKLKLHSKNAAAEPRLRIELVGKLLHAKVIEQRPYATCDALNSSSAPAWLQQARSGTPNTTAAARR